MIKSRMDFIINSFNTYRFKAIFLILIIISFYGVVDAAINTGFLYGLFCIYTNQWVVSILMFCIFLNAINYCSLYKNNYSVILRCKNKEQHLKETIINVVISNSLIVLISVILTCIPLLIKYPGDFGSYVTINEANLYFYIPFMILRLIVFINVLSIITVSIYYSCKEIVSLVVSLALSISVLIFSYSVLILDNFKWFFGSYLVNPMFPNITNDICYTLLQVLILMIISLSLFKITTIIKKDLI